jgi:hypothetical protein
MKTSLRATANKLLDNYGNTVVLTKTITTGKVYNPTTDEYVGSVHTTTVNTKCIYKQYKQGVLNIEDDKRIKRIAIVAYQDDIASLDTSWKFNNNTIFVVEQSAVEDGTVIFNLYVG